MQDQRRNLAEQPRRVDPDREVARIAGARIRADRLRVVAYGVDSIPTDEAGFAVAVKPTLSPTLDVL